MDYTKNFKKLIVTADDLGLSESINTAVFDALKNGFLTSCCIVVNSDFYNDAVERIKAFSNIDIGIHLNIFENKPVSSNIALLTDKYGDFCKTFLFILFNSFKKNFLDEIEKEFSAQIEKLIKDNIKPSFISSHVHIHSIPAVFEIVCKLASKYNINYVRTQDENFCFVLSKNNINLKYLINIIKWLILKLFTAINKKTIIKYNLKTNENFIGVLYTQNMDSNTVLSGVKKIKNNAEVIFHPDSNNLNKNNYKEYQTLIDKKLIQKLKNMNIDLTKWINL